MRLAASASRQLILLAPSQRAVPAVFARMESDPQRHRDLLVEAQKFRGRVYLEDGAIQPWQLIDGRHRLDTDYGSWHLLVLNSRGHVCGCMRYREYPASTDFSELTVSQSALTSSREWSGKLRTAVEAEIDLSRELDYPLSEIGGWALDEELRGTAEALSLALVTYALTQELGGSVGLSSATHRHDSASILRRIGGRPLEFNGAGLPPYYDPQYDCQMEILRFYSWSPNPRYSLWVDAVKADLRSAQVITSGVAGPEWVAAFRARPLQSVLRRSAPAS